MSKPNEVSKENMSASITNPKTEHNSIIDFLQSHLSVSHEARGMKLETSAKNQLTQSGVLPKMDLTDHASKFTGGASCSADAKAFGVNNSGKTGGELADGAELWKQTQRRKDSDTPDLSSRVLIGTVPDRGDPLKEGKLAGGDEFAKQKQIGKIPDAVDAPKGIPVGKREDGAESIRLKVGKREATGVDLGKYISKIHLTEQ